ncbi:MAG: O-antigen ligase family protein [Phycisphaerales bacterium]|nr:O-antigen ligase family protein [Phycisphaerales bacterium]
MRFILYVSILLTILPLVFFRPFFGLCIYYVVSLLQPKLLCWRDDFQDSLLIGVPFVIGAIAIGVRNTHVLPDRDQVTGQIKGVITKITRSKLFEPSWMIAISAMLVIYISITRFLTPFPLEHTSYQFRSFCKVLLVAALLTGLVTDSRRFRILFLVIALSTAFWAIKGGLKVILIGPHQVYGKSYDNNLFALTSVMALPMVFYFGLSVKHARWRALLLVCSALMCLAIIGSRSRAGFVAFAVILMCMAWGSRYRLRALFGVMLVVGLVAALSSKEVTERIDSILAYRDDFSARSRFRTWEVARGLFVKSPLIGVGFNNFELAQQQYFGGRKAAHNIFLQNLSELGIIGHPLWLAIIFGSMLSLLLFMRRARSLPPDMRWSYHCSRGLLLGMLGFCLHGFFHNEEYLELMFAMVGLGIALQTVTKRELRTRRLIAMSEGGQGEDEDRVKGDRPTPIEGHPGRLFDRPRSLGALIRYGIRPAR